MKTTIGLVALMSAAIGLNSLAPLFASETDQRIESSAKKTYVYRNYLKHDDIKIASKDGAVTLTGTVAEESHKALAEDTVKGLPGVRSVDNGLVVKSPPPEANSDAWISAKVKAALMFHRSTSAKTQVYVTDGVVTLKGIASSQAEKDLTTEHARDIEGVKEVKNQMTVAKNGEPEQTLGEKIDDASITAQVKVALLTHRSTSALRTDVDTKDGIVTLTGTATNQAEKDLVTKLVTDIKGVKNVKNDMAIEPQTKSGKRQTLPVGGRRTAAVC